MWTSLPGSADECVTASGEPREPYQGILDEVVGFPERLHEMQRGAQAWFASRHITFGVPGADSQGDAGGQAAPIFPFDPIPRILSALEWSRLERALVQRAIALDTFVADCYGAQRALRYGVVPAGLVYSSAGYLRDLVGGRPPRSDYCHVAGIDIVRVSGEFLALEDNVRVPSGIAYALMSREATVAVAPGWLTANPVRSIDGYAARLRSMLQRIAPRQWDASLVVLTPGRYNAAYFEHQLLAEAIGGTLVEGRDLIVQEDEVWRQTPGGGHELVDVIYSRVNAEWLDPLVFRSDSLLGVPGLIEAWRRGSVAIANAPGTGVADDKALYPFVPAMIRYYLGETPLLDGVPTYDISDDRQRQHVVANLEKMVLKPVDASGGYGILFGDHLSFAESEDAGRRLEAEPRGWLAQEQVQLSRAVCVSPEGRLEARCIDLRPFVLLDEQPWVVPGGLTRVAANPLTLIVNSSQGGGSKDTWVLSD